MHGRGKLRFGSKFRRLGLLRTLALVFHAGFEYLLLSQHHVLRRRVNERGHEKCRVPRKPPTSASQKGRERLTIYRCARRECRNLEGSEPFCFAFVLVNIRWEQALEAYERARDMDSVVRLCLDQLDQSHRAFAIVRENASRWAVLALTRTATFLAKQ